MAISRKIFVNLPVRDLGRTKAFFAALGFAFNAQFTNEHGACMVLSEDGYVMLLTHTFFGRFTRRAIADTSVVTECLVALSCSSRAEVDELLGRALGAGGVEAAEGQDMGFMYQRSFYDLDGHHWEIFWMDPATVQGE